VINPLAVEATEPRPPGFKSKQTKKSPETLILKEMDANLLSLSHLAE
jgi:hypothetical protein